MNRLYTMARFAEPEEVAPISECDFCKEELYEGETVFKNGNEIFCSAECVAGAYCYEEIL